MANRWTRRKCFRHGTFGHTHFHHEEYLQSFTWYSSTRLAQHQTHPHLPPLWSNWLSCHIYSIYPPPLNRSCVSTIASGVVCCVTTLFTGVYHHVRQTKCQPNCVCSQGESSTCFTCLQSVELIMLVAHVQCGSAMHTPQDTLRDDSILVDIDEDEEGDEIDALEVFGNCNATATTKHYLRVLTS